MARTEVVKPGNRQGQCRGQGDGGEGGGKPARGHVPGKEEGCATEEGRRAEVVEQPVLVGEVGWGQDESRGQEESQRLRHG
jgi:hypothetical protein